MTDKNTITLELYQISGYQIFLDKISPETGDRKESQLDQAIWKIVIWPVIWWEYWQFSSGLYVYNILTYVYSVDANV